MMKRRQFMQAAVVAAATWPVLVEGRRPKSDETRFCLGSVCFPREGTVGEVKLPLRGVVRLTWWGFSVYTMALYVGSDAKNFDEVLGDRTRRLVLHYHRNIDGSDIRKASEYWIKRNENNDLEAMRERLDQLLPQIKSVRNGDEYFIDYRPGVGTTIALNGADTSEPIPGADLARAFFGIWLSEEPIKRDLRDRLVEGNLT